MHQQNQRETESERKHEHIENHFSFRPKLFIIHLNGNIIFFLAVVCGSTEWSNGETGCVCRAKEIEPGV